MKLEPVARELEPFTGARVDSVVSSCTVLQSVVKDGGASIAEGKVTVWDQGGGGEGSAKG